MDHGTEIHGEPFLVQLGSIFGVPDSNHGASAPLQVWFFEQGTMPCLSPDGKIILETEAQPRQR